MVATVLFLSSFLLCLYHCPGLSVAGKPPVEEIKQNRDVVNQENRILFSFSDFATQLDTIPIVNPSTPTATTPIVNPITSPPGPVYTEPTMTPPATTTPTTPTTSPPTTPTTTTPTAPTTTSTGAWCIASPTASETALQVALDYACGYGGADCAAIQSGGSCYNPNTVHDHASYAFNDYYQKNPAPTSCVFGGTAQLSYTDPSSVNCHYASPSTTSSGNPMTPATPTESTPTTPTESTPTTIPTGSTVYGSEPTGTPTYNSAVSMSCSLLLFATTCLLPMLLTANYL